MMPTQFIVQEGNPLVTQPIGCAMCGQPFKVGDLGVLIPMPGAPDTGFYARVGPDNVNAMPVHVPCVERANDLFTATAEFGRFVLQVMEGTVNWDADMLDLIAGKAVNLGLAEAAGPGMMFKSRFNKPAETPAETVHSDQPAPDTNENRSGTADGAEGNASERGDQRDPGA